MENTIHIDSRPFSLVLKFKYLLVLLLRGEQKCLIKCGGYVVPGVTISASPPLEAAWVVG